jgi:hypothetical protein
MAIDKTANHYKRHLTTLSRYVSAVLDQIDLAMKEPPSVERGKKIAAILNELEMANDSAWHFGLGKSLKHRGRNRRANKSMGV